MRRLLTISLLLALGCERTAVEPAPSAAPSIELPPPAKSSGPTQAASSAPAAPAPRAPAVTIAASGPFDVVDLHVDTPWRVHFKKRPLDLPEGHATPALLRQGAYAAIVFPIYIPDYADKSNPQIKTGESIFDTIDKLVSAHELFAGAFAGNKQPLRTVPDDKVAVFVSIEGAGAFAADITQIDRFIARGVRVIGPVHMHDNDLAASATGDKDFGLTELGKQFCERVYTAGALIDVSHMSDGAFAALVPIAKRFNAPIVATHSNARALAKHPRNLTDEQLRIIGETGGVAGINLHRAFVSDKKKPQLGDVVAQALHMVKLAGAEHVAIGTDFDGGNPVTSLADAGKMPALAQALVAAGLAEADVRKIFGANAVRILAWGLP